MSLKTDQSHDCLVAVRVLSGHGLFHLRQLVKELKVLGTLDSFSSIYKLGAMSTGEPSKGSLQPGFFTLAVVVKIRTSQTLNDFFKELKEIEIQWTEKMTRRATSVWLYLLAFGQTARMTPELTLPYPELHLNPEFLVPATEVWSEYHHVILNEALSKLAQKLEPTQWGEFYAQGKSLLDF